MKKLSLIVVAGMLLAGFSIVQGAEKAKEKVVVKKAAPQVKCTSAKKCSKDTSKACPKTAEACAKTEKCPVTAAATAEPKKKWDFIQLGFWFDVPSSTVNTDVYGVKVGAPFCSGKGLVNGIETAVICGATDNINGLQACIILSKSKNLTGLQFAIVNYCENVKGVQLGVVNLAEKKSFQIGILNYIKDNTFPWMPIMNFRF